MKKIVLFCVVAFLLSVSSASAKDWVQVSEVNSASALITSKVGYWAGISVTSDGANNITLDVYDNTAAGGKKMVQTLQITTSASNRVHTFSIDPPTMYQNGIYVAVTCAGTMSYVVYFAAQ